MALKITDLVDASAIAELESLKRKMEEVKQIYYEAARDLANGLKVTVEVKGDLDKLNQIYAASAQRAAEATQRLNDVVRQQEELNARTTASISRKLDAINEEEKATRTKIQLDRQTAQMANDILGTYSQNARMIAQYNNELKNLKKSQTELTKAYDLGRLSQSEYYNRMGALEAQIKTIKVAKQDLERINTNEAKINTATAGSYTELSLQLERMKMAYKMMNEEEKNSASGQQLGAAIKELDASLKESAQDMGEFQRNVGNYAVAAQNGVTATQEEVNAIREKIRTGQELTETERSIAVEMEKAAQAGKLQEQSIKSEAAAAQNASGSYNELKARYADLIAQMNSLNPNTDKWRQLAEQARGVKEEMERVKAQTGDTDKALQEVVGTTDDYTKTLQTAVLGNGKFGTSVAGLTTLLKSGGLTTALSAAGTAIGAFGKALWALATNPYFLAITAALVAIKGLYEGVSFWVNYNEETAHAKRITGEFLDLSNEGLTEMFVNIKAIAETYGKDYTDVLNAVDTLVSQFGADAKEAAEIINIGMAAGADEGGRMLEMIKKFSPSFRDAGLSARQLVAVIQQTRSGIFNEEGMNAMKYAFKQLRKMGTEDGKNIARAVDGIGLSWKKMKEDMNNGSITMLDAVQQISAKLKGLPQTSQEVGAVFQQVFGRNGADVGTATIESIADLETNLEKVLETTGEVGKSQLALKDATEEFDTALETLFGVSEGGWETMKNNIKIVLYQIGTKLLTELIKLYNAFVDLWNELGVLRGAVAALIGVWLVWYKVTWTFVKGVIQGMTAIIKTIKAVGTVLSALHDVVFEVFTGIGRSLKSILSALNPANILDGSAKIELAFDNVGSAVSRFKSVFSSALSEAIGAWGEFFSDLHGGVQEIVGDAKKMASFVEFVGSDDAKLQKRELPIASGGGGGLVGYAVAKGINAISGTVGGVLKKLGFKGELKEEKKKDGDYTTPTESKADIEKRERAAAAAAKAAANKEKREAAARERAAKAAENKRITEQKKTQREKERLAKEHKKYMEDIIKSLSSTLVDIETDANQKAINEITTKYAELRSKIKKEGLTAEEQQTEMLLEENYGILENRELEQKIGTTSTVQYIKDKYEAQRKELEKQNKLTQEQIDYMNVAMEREISKLIGSASDAGVTAVRGGGQRFAIVGSIQREYDAMLSDLYSAFEEGSSEYYLGLRMKTSNEIDAFYDEWAQKIQDDPKLKEVVDAWATAITKTSEEGIAKSQMDQVAKKVDFGRLGVGQAQATIKLTKEYNQEQKNLFGLYEKGLIKHEEYEKEKQRISKKYEMDIAEMNLKVLKEQLKTENLSEQDRLELLKQIADAEVAINEAKNEQIEQDNEEANEKRKASIEKIKELAQEALAEVFNFGSAIFDARIQKLEEQEDANQEAYDKEVERIEALEERGVISSEEAEKRKTAAKKKADKENEALEKKKAKLKYQQAVWEKAASIASIGISTAEAIMAIWADKSLTTYAKPAMTALAAGIGAVQLATILATPIPKYAKGTDYHEGGAAVVGDAGREELVEFGGNFFVTPKKPTLVDLPKGAKVYPDANDLSWLTDRVFAYPRLNDNQSTVIVNNDYKALERILLGISRQQKNKMRQERILANRMEFEAYKAARI